MNLKFVRQYGRVAEKKWSAQVLICQCRLVEEGGGKVKRKKGLKPTE